MNSLVLVAMAALVGTGCVLKGRWSSATMVVVLGSFMLSAMN